MDGPQWGASDEARRALRAIVSDPAYGVAALSSSQIMANLLKDLLPDAPREVSILVAAAEADVASNLRDRVSQGMDVGTACAVVAGSFAATTPYRPEACSWAVSEIAGALGLSSPGPGSAVPSGSPAPGGAPPTMSAPMVAAGPPAAPSAYPAGAYPAGAYSPAQAQPPPPRGYWPQPPAPGLMPAARTNGLAIASLVLGVLWLFWLGSLAGLILGLIALRQIKRRNQGGRGLAIAGVVLSILWLLGFVVAVIIGASKGS